MTNYLIAGLGNIGDEYARTRHNIGFMILDALAKASNIVFDDKRYGFVATMPLRGNRLTLLKPSTYMNLSGNAVRYWINEKKIRPENLLVVVDDLSLPFGKIRIKPSGSEGGHNGLKSIIASLGTEEFYRIRIGIGAKPNPQYDLAAWVLGKLPPEDRKAMTDRYDDIEQACRLLMDDNLQYAQNKFNR